MSRFPHPRSIVISCLMLLSAQVAIAKIVECVDPSGAVTYTDVPCKVDEDAISIGRAIDKPIIKETVSLQKEKKATTGQAGAVIALAMQNKHHGLGTDVATMKAARDMIASMDRNSKLAHLQTFTTSYY